MLKKIEPVIPGVLLAGGIVDVSTPVTSERYTDATDGAMYDVVNTVSHGLRKPNACTPYRNLFTTGTKAYGVGGIVSSLLGGLQAVRALGVPANGS